MSQKPLIEIGWVVAGPLGRVDLEAVEAGREEMRAFLDRRFPDFDWQMPLVQRPESVGGDRVEPVTLLDLGVLDRDASGWDYAIVVTETELLTHHKSFALGAPSQAVSVACLSTARLDPLARRVEVTDEERVALMSRRIRSLALHLFGHLAGLPHGDEPTDLMFDLTVVQDLDPMERFSAQAVEQLAGELSRIADVRLEEAGRYRGRELVFYLKALIRGAPGISGAIVEARPWLFPLRFSKLTTAAASAMLILVVTAEVWELAMSQSVWRVVVASVVALLATSGYLLKRQRLLSRRRTRRLSEQRVISNVSMTLSLFLGMTSTYALLFGVTLGLALFFFAPSLVAGWAGLIGGVEAGVGLDRYLVLAGFVAAVGLVIGALGASFEARGYFRHIALVDEET